MFRAVVCTVVASVLAQVPVTKEPHHRIVFEDAQLRVLDVNVPPRELTLDHRHDHDIATISVSPADTRTISPGQPWGPVRPRRDPGHAQTTEYTGKPGTHTIENVGATLYRLIAVENLRSAFAQALRRDSSAGPAINAPATTLAIESRAFRVYDVRLGADAPLTRHVHQTPVVAVLAAGAVVADTEPARRVGPQSGPTSQRSPSGRGATRPGEGGALQRLDQPGQWVVIRAGELHRLVNAGTATHVVEIEVR